MAEASGRQDAVSTISRAAASASSSVRRDGDRRGRLSDSPSGSGRRGFPRAAGRRPRSSTPTARDRRPAFAAGERIERPMARAGLPVAQHTEAPRDDRRAAALRRCAAAAPGSARPDGPRRRARTLAATQRAQTMASSSELLASRLAPCSPVRRLRRRPRGRRPSCGRRRPRRCRPCGNARPGGSGSARRRIDAGLRRPRRSRKARGEVRSGTAPRVEKDAMAAGAVFQTARATTSRGASSAPGTSAMKRRPVSSMRDRAFAAHRLADQRHRRAGPSSAVGWN